MPDPNGTVFIMQFAHVIDVEQYLYALCNRMESAMYQIIQYVLPVYCMDVNNTSRASQLFSRKMSSVGPCTANIHWAIC